MKYDRTCSASGMFVANGMYVYIYSPDMDIQKYTVTIKIIVNSVKISSPIGVMSFNELWRKSLYNFKQRVTKGNNFIVNHVYNFTRATSKIWKNSDHILYIL